MILAVGCIIKPKHLSVKIDRWLSRLSRDETEFSQEGIDLHEKRESVWKRKLVNKMYFEQDHTKREIVDFLGVSTNFVVKWTQSEDQDFTEDGRGWEKGRPRKWKEGTVKRIKRIREELEEDPSEDYWGPSAIEVEYRKRHPEKEVPPLRTIGKILKGLGVTKNQKNEKSRGALRYLRYPEHTIYEKLGDRLLEADFVGDKYITGRSKPLHFIGYSFKHEPRLRHYKRVKGETKDEFKTYTQKFFDRFEVPDLMKVDNSSTTIGGGFHKRIISDVMAYLLERKVYPVFSVPRKPATQASIEGSNSLFSRKFWNRHQFESLEEIDERLVLFNQNTREYLGYTPPEKKDTSEGTFKPKVYFLRQVREEDNGNDGFIDIVNEKVKLDSEYIKYFVLGEWDLDEEKLSVRFEQRDDEEDEDEEVKSKVIKQLEFPIHKGSKRRCKKFLS